MLSVQHKSLNDWYLERAAACCIRNALLFTRCVNILQRAAPVSLGVQQACLEAEAAACALSQCSDGCPRLCRCQGGFSLSLSHDVAEFIPTGYL